MRTAAPRVIDAALAARGRYETIFFPRRAHGSICNLIAVCVFSFLAFSISRSMNLDNISFL